MALDSKDSNAAASAVSKERPRSAGGFGVVEYKKFGVPSFKRSRDAPPRKRRKIEYAESGFADDGNDGGAYDDDQARAKKLKAKANKAKNDDSDDDKPKHRGPGDNYVPPPPPRTFAVFRPKDSRATLGSQFSIPGIKRKGQIVETRFTGAQLGVRRSASLIPRPLHDPLADQAIVLWDPTIDDLEAERERAAAEQRAKEAVDEQDEAARMRAKVHKSLAEILGIASREEAEAQRRRVKVPVVIDPRVGKVLRPHQVEGVKFLYKCVTGMKDENAFGCIMADEMGLGKTLQCITLLWTLLKQSPIPNKPGIDKAIVVCPSSLVNNWANELVKWLGPGAISPLACDGKLKPVELIPRLRQWCSSHGKSVATPVIIVSYEKLRDLTDEIGNTEVGLLLCDEGHRLKNSENQTYTALYNLNCKRRVILTGTPIQNDLDEYFSLLNFCNPGYLGTKVDFHKNFENPIAKGRDGEATDKQKELGDKKLKELNTLVSKFIIRRTNDLLTKYLPVKYEHVVFCGLSPFQLKLYQYFMKSPIMQALLRGKESKPLKAITFLRKLVNHPDLLNLREELEGCEDTWPEGYDQGDKRRKLDPELSGKMAVLSRWLVKMKAETDDKIVLISNFTQTLDLFEKLCRDYKIGFLRLDGTLANDKRIKLVNQFNDPASGKDVFLLSSKAGGCGLNLIGANRLILFDPDWNPAADMQALARVWRDGQKKACFVYRFVAAGTVEEKIFQRQSHKQNLSSCVVDEKEDVERHFSGDGLRQLFTYKDIPCETHDLFKCKRCKGDKQFIKAPAMLYGDTSTWNHFLTNESLAGVHDDFLRSETGLEHVKACFQFNSI